MAQRACRISKEGRSRIMRAIRSKNTSIEMRLRKELFRRGYRYRIHYSEAIGKPDVAFPRLRVAIFIDSEFWHGFEWEKNRDKIMTNRKYWIPKIERNIQRDREVTEELRKSGWTVLRFWGRDITENVEDAIMQIEEALESSQSRINESS